MNHRVLLVAFIVAGAACGGRNLDAGPEATVIVVDDDDGAGGFGEGGEGGEGGQGGEGGSVPPPPNPIDCIACVALECPETVACLTDAACVQGLVCTLTQCLAGGEPDLVCVAGCFDGDFEAAFQAIQALTCVLGTCGDVCGGFLPF
jgi:hypothetical protein